MLGATSGRRLIKYTNIFSRSDKMKKKKWYKSKTVWFNIVSGAVMAASEAARLGIDPKVAGIVVVVGNIVLRLMTREGIK